MHREVVSLDGNIGPNASHQIMLADQLAAPFQQSNQYLQSTTSEGNRILAFQQQKLCRKQAKGTKCNFG
jgi:hypothetical protein